MNPILQVIKETLLGLERLKLIPKRYFCQNCEIDITDKLTYHEKRVLDTGVKVRCMKCLIKYNCYDF